MNQLSNQSFSKEAWGSLVSGEAIELYTLRNSHGFEAAITTYGGRLVTLKVPDRRGRVDDVVLGFDSLEGYTGDNPYFGALIGRYANRIANGRFTLNGKMYELARNNGANSLHGGWKGFDRVVWGAKEVSSDNGRSLQLKYLSTDGEEGYPGNLDVTVTYSLGNRALEIEYEATTDKDTVLNLTNHSYFDLAGQSHGNIMQHLVTIYADQFTPVNEHLIPTGELRNVEGTPFDFRNQTAIGARIDDGDEQIRYGEGYDHNFVLRREGGGLSVAARVLEPESGRVLEVLTTQPGVQFYTGNHLRAGLKGKGGAVYGTRSAFCVETQHFPDSPNHPNFPSTVLRAGERYLGATVLRFSVDGARK